jgi:hypothetical protein
LIAPDAAMWISQVFSRAWFGIVSLLIGAVKSAAWIITAGSALCFAFVVSAQLTRLYQKGDWNLVPFTDLLEILQIPRPMSGTPLVQEILDLLLALPATILLLAIALVSYGIKRLVDRIKLPRHPAKTSPEDDRDLLAAIEQALDATSKRAKL